MKKQLSPLLFSIALTGCVMVVVHPKATSPSGDHRVLCGQYEPPNKHPLPQEVKIVEREGEYEEFLQDVAAELATYASELKAYIQAEQDDSDTAYRRYLKTCQQ